MHKFAGLIGIFLLSGCFCKAGTLFLFFCGVLPFLTNWFIVGISFPVKRLELIFHYH